MDGENMENNSQLVLNNGGYDNMVNQ